MLFFIFVTTQNLTAQIIPFTTHTKREKRGQIYLMAPNQRKINLSPFLSLRLDEPKVTPMPPLLIKPDFFFASKLSRYVLSVTPRRSTSLPASVG
ncbi:MAG: hypothetical protein C0439_04475 [Pseudomonas sp.]|nr:hypothetical protein [Pseudomonas sp.]